MDRISDKKKCMAALAVFRNLYEQKQDVYFVISEFIKLVIAENALKSLDVSKMVGLLNECFGFELPIEVVKTSIKRLDFLERNGQLYNVLQDKTFDAKAIKEAEEHEIQENDEIINRLFIFAENIYGNELTEDARTELSSEFCAYVIDENNAPTYGNLISQFIITNSKDSSFVSQLNQIRQGVVLYVGLNYNTNYNAIDRIDTPLYIYLDTEILFHMFGLNGILYQRLFDEFYELVQEINKKARKPVIKLRYFAESEVEIDTYFRIAERIVRGEETLTPGRDAMLSIVNGCEDAYKVVEKKAALFEMLKDKQISLDSQEHYYDKEENYRFLLDSKYFYDNKGEGMTNEDIDRKINLLNYISIKRGGKSQRVFRNVGHILLSANKVTFMIAFDSTVRESNCVPLATNLNFLTNRFWLSLNKGLSTICSLQSLNIITKAQIALSSGINENVYNLYNKLREDEKVGRLTEGQMKSCLAELHMSTVSPESISSENVNDIYEIVNFKDIQLYVAERELLSAQNAKEREQLIRQIDDLKQKQEEFQSSSQRKREEDEAKLMKAAEEIAKIRNEKEKNQYENDLKEYNQNKECSVKEFCKVTFRKSIVIASFYVLFIIILYVFTWLYPIEREGCHCVKVLISFIIGLVGFGIPFVRPLIDHGCIKYSFRYILSSKYRDELRYQAEQAYVQENNPPTERYYTIDEIMQELQSR